MATIVADTRRSPAAFSDDVRGTALTYAVARIDVRGVSAMRSWDACGTGAGTGT